MGKRNLDGQRADELLADGLAELEARRQEPIIDPKDEAAAEESLECHMMREIEERLATEDLQFGPILHEVIELVEILWPDCALRQVAEQHSLSREDKFELLRRFRDSACYQDWVKEAGGEASSSLAGLEAEWLTESD